MWVDSGQPYSTVQGPTGERRWGYSWTQVLYQQSTCEGWSTNNCKLYWLLRHICYSKLWNTYEQTLPFILQSEPNGLPIWDGSRWDVNLALQMECLPKPVKNILHIQLLKRPLEMFGKGSHIQMNILYIWTGIWLDKRGPVRFFYYQLSHIAAAHGFPFGPSGDIRCVSVLFFVLF